MGVILLSCAFFIAGGDPGSGPWYEKNAADAIAKAKQANRTEAMRHLEEMRKQAEKQDRKDWQVWVEWQMGQCEYYLGNLTKAIEIYEKVESNKALPMRLKYDVVRDRGDALLDSGNPEKALNCFKDADKLGKFDPDERVRINLRLIQCQIGIGDMDEARDGLGTQRKALDALKAKAREERWACLDANWNLLQASMDLDARNPLRALARLNSTQKNLTKVKRDPDLAMEALDLRFRCHIGQASDFWLVARFADADAQLTLAESLVASVATERNQASLKNARAALILEKSALAIEGEFQAPEMLADLGKAKSSLEAALGHLKKAGSGADHLTTTIEFQISQVHELRGRVLDSQGKPREARLEYEAAKEQCEKTLNWRAKTHKASHDLVLEARTLHAWLNLRLGNAKEAQKEGAEALKLFDDVHKKNDLDRGRMLHVLLEAENKLGNTKAAVQYAQEHRRLVDDGLGTLVAGLSPSEQIQFFRRWDTPGLNASLRMGIQHGDDPQLAAACVEWLINGKSKLTEVLAAQVKAARQADQQQFIKLQKSVQRQAYLMYGEPVFDAAALQSLRREFLVEEALQRDLAESAAKIVGSKTRWYGLPEVREHLRADELYVGIYSLRPHEGAARVYHAWLVGPQGPVQSVSLGDAKPIDDLVKVFVREQERAPLIAPGEEKAAERFLRAHCLEELSRRVLHPIRKLAGGAKRWIISPDGPLWNIPWAALLLPDNQYAIEELAFRYAVSGQDLVPDKMPAATSEPLVVGDPWFNYPDTDMLRLRKPGVDPLRLPWNRLENSRRECDAVLAIMEDCKLKPNRMFGAVQKSQLMGLPGVPRMVYFSTHAFATLPSSVQVDDPLLSCALALAGWNNLPGAGDSSLPGLMTGAEVLGMDLRGTELVVLASCAAAQEELTYGRSPANLRHAFHLAGARSVVSALWGTNDKATLEVMELFIGSVCQPKADKVSALREAQQQSIRHLKMYRDHTHPFYWAGFTISGS